MITQSKNRWEEVDRILDGIKSLKARIENPCLSNLEEYIEENFSK